MTFSLRAVEDKILASGFSTRCDVEQHSNLSQTEPNFLRDAAQSRPRNFGDPEEEKDELLVTLLLQDTKRVNVLPEVPSIGTALYLNHDLIVFVGSGPMEDEVRVWLLASERGVASLIGFRAEGEGVCRQHATQLVIKLVAVDPFSLDRRAVACDRQREVLLGHLRRCPFESFNDVDHSVVRLPNGVAMSRAFFSRRSRSPGSAHTHPRPARR
jgi:hypothetical protein